MGIVCWNNYPSSIIAGGTQSSLFSYCNLTQSLFFLSILLVIACHSNLSLVSLCNTRLISDISYIPGEDPQIILKERGAELKVLIADIVAERVFLHLIH